jgi:hypothetical protein
MKLIITFRTYYNFYIRKYTYKKFNLIEVINILLLDLIFDYYIPYELKLYIYYI